MTNFAKFVNNLFIEGYLNFKSEPNDNFTVTMYSPESNIAYKCTFCISNITVPNTNLEGIYKMVKNAFDSNPSYSINWQLKDFNFVITYQHDIFTFTQMINFSTINFSTIDIEMVQLKYQLFQNKQEINQLKTQTVPIEKFCELSNKYDEMIKLVETLKVDIGKLKINDIKTNPNTGINGINGTDGINGIVGTCGIVGTVGTVGTVGNTDDNILNPVPNTSSSS